MMAMAGSCGGSACPGCCCACACGVASSSMKSRPTRIRAPSRRKTFGVAAATRICSGVPVASASGVRPAAVTPAKSSKRFVDWRRRSRKSGGEKGQSFTLRARSSPQTRTRRRASLYGSGRSNTAFTTLKIAVHAPMPSAMVNPATTENPRFFRSPRAAYTRSLTKVSMWPLRRSGGHVLCPIGWLQLLDRLEGNAAGLEDPTATGIASFRNRTWVRPGHDTGAPCVDRGSQRVGSGETRTMSLPKFFPASRPMNAAGACSSPSAMSSRYRSRPSRTQGVHSARNAGKRS
jgi:hypothetical protein